MSDLRDYLDYLIQQMTDDQSFPLGVRQANEVQTVVSLPKGKYVWKVDNRFRNSNSYRATLRHAGNGSAGAFKFVAFDDKTSPGEPGRRLQESSLMTKHGGQVSTWTVNTDALNLYVGFELPNDNTHVFVTYVEPAGYRGLDPRWFTGPVGASGSQMQVGQSGDLLIATTPDDRADLGERYSGLQLEPMVTGITELSRYYHTDFATTDESTISLVTFCADMLQHFLAHYPGGVILFQDRAAWQQVHPDGTERGYLDYLLLRLTQQPINMGDPAMLPERLSRRYRTNFVAPETVEGTRVEFLISLLQRDLRDRDVSFDIYQQWLNGGLRRRFPENFYSYQFPLIRFKDFDPAAIDRARASLPQHHSIQLVLEVLQSAFSIDPALSRANRALTRGEYGTAFDALGAAEQALAFVFHHNYFLNSKLTPSKWVANVRAEIQGVHFDPPLRDQIRSQTLDVTSVNKGYGLANIHALLFPGVSLLATLDQVDVYPQRRRRQASQLDALLEDVHLDIGPALTTILDRLVALNGNYTHLTNAEKTTFSTTVRDIWRMMTHYAYFLIPLIYGEAFKAAGQYEQARLYYQLILDGDKPYTSQMITYEYLNPAIEVPFMTLRIAEALVAHADWLLRSQDFEARVHAQTLYEDAQWILQRNVSAGNPAAHQLLAASAIGLLKIQHNLNALGYRADFAPIFRYPYLISLTDELVQYAVDAGRQLVTFIQQAEQATQGELEAEQALQMNRALIEVERLRVQDAAVQTGIALLQRAQISQEIVDLGAKIDELDDPEFFWAAVGTGLQSGMGFAATGAALGGPIGALIGIIATSESGPGAVVGGAVGGVAGIGLGALGGGYLAYAQGAAQWKAHQSQLNDYARSASLLQSFGAPIADRQIASAHLQEAIAGSMLSIAQLRETQSRELAALMRTQFFNADRLYALANQMRAIYLTRLRYAHEVAFLAEQALEYELNERVDLIGFHYDAPQNLLLGAEHLRSDIAALETARVERFTRKRLPATVSISLAEEAPLALFDLVSTGEAFFTTDFALFERLYPGAYQSRISRVELVFFALVPQEGLHGTLSSSGLSFVKDREGTVAALINPPETMLVSQYEIRDGNVYFYDTREHFHPFEAMGLVTDWRLEIPPSANQLDYTTIYDVQLVIHFTSLYDEALAVQVLAQQAPMATALRSFSLRDAFPDAFYHLTQDGTGQFTLSPRHFRQSQINGRIRSLMLIHALSEGNEAAAIESTLQYQDTGGHPGRFRSR